jgi:hypothetical protein
VEPAAGELDGEPELLLLLLLQAASVSASAAVAATAASRTGRSVVDFIVPPSCVG